MPFEPSFTELVRTLPASVPFVGPEALERRNGRTLWLRLGANESAFGVSPFALLAMQKALDHVSWYADPDNHELRAELAARHKVQIENVAVGGGIDDLLGWSARAFLEPGKVAVHSLGGYPTFNYHVLGFGGRLEFIPYRDDRNDLVGLAQAALRTNAAMVFLANPDNPTGSWFAADVIREFMSLLPAGCLLLLDEAYIDFAPPGQILPVDLGEPRVIRLRTFSKAHGMAGLRVGYAVAAPEIISAFDKIRLHYGMNRIAQIGALASLRDPSFIQEVIGAVAQGRREYAELAREVSLTALPSAANFVAFDLGSRERAQAVLSELLQRGVFVRSPGVPPLDRLVRVTVGTAAERAEFAHVFREVIPHLGGSAGQR